MKRIEFKYILIISVLLFAAGTKVSAQNKEQTIKLGIQIPFTVGWIGVDNNGYTDNGARAGIKYGLISEFRLFGSPNYAFASGLFLNHTGGKISRPGVVLLDSIYRHANVTSTYKLRYIDIPIAIKLKTNEIGYLTYWGQFGVELGFNIRARENRETILSGVPVVEDNLSVKEDIEVFRSALIVQAGIEFNISGNTNLIVGLGYTNGFTNVFSGDAYAIKDGKVILDGAGNPTYDGKLSSRLNYFSLFIGFLF